MTVKKMIGCYAGQFLPSSLLSMFFKCDYIVPHKFYRQVHWDHITRLRHQTLRVCHFSCWWSPYCESCWPFHQVCVQPIDSWTNSFAEPAVCGGERERGDYYSIQCPAGLSPNDVFTTPTTILYHTVLYHIVPYCTGPLALLQFTSDDRSKMTRNKH